MNILNKITVRNLKLNKTRTLVTIIGIIMSVVLITITIGLISSYQRTTIIHSIEDSGDYHVKFKNLSDNDRKLITSNIHVEKYFYTNDVGYVNIFNNDKKNNYLKIIEYSDEALDESNIRLVEGRLPKNNNEILIQKRMYNYGYEKKIGDTISLEITENINSEKLEKDENLANEENLEYINSILDKKIKDYTIVGVFDYLSFNEKYDFNARYYAISYNNNFSNPSNMYVKYDNPTKTLEYLCPITSDNKKDENKCLNNFEFNSKIDYELNDDLLTSYLVTYTKTEKDTVMFVLIAIISLIAISCIIIIKNGFSISVNERFKQYGMLSSIGATSKQIKKNVLYEGLIEGIIGIPIGLLLGCLLVKVLVFVTNNVVASNLDYIGINYKQLLYYNIPIFVLAIIMIVSSITIFLSCLIPAIKASKITPIEAIRENKTIKIKKRKIKSSKLINKLFGISGVLSNKNIKRNKKKYRTITISLTISIIILITSSVELRYAFEEEKDFYGGYNYNARIIRMMNSEESDEEEKSKMLDSWKDYENLKNNALIDKCAYYRRIVTGLKRNITEYEINTILKEASKEGVKIDDNAKKAMDILREKGILAAINVVNDDEFKRLSKNTNYSDDDLKNGALVYNYEHIEDEMKGKLIKNRVLDLSNTKSLDFKYYENDTDDSENVIPTNTFSLKILGEVDIKDSLLTQDFQSLTIVVSEKFLEEHSYLNVDFVSEMFIYTSEADNLEDYFYYAYGSKNYYYFNCDKEMKAIENILLIFSIFLYTFVAIVSIISLTNLFNTISTSMMLRKKEFAVLKSVGMTDKEFKKMIILESSLYSLKALFYGLIISIVFVYFIVNAGKDNYSFVGKILNLFRNIPYLNIIITIIFVFIIILLTMLYSLSKINKQNIIETIRNDNI